MKLNPINFEWQFDKRPYLINETGGQIAQRLNEVVNLDLIDISLKNIEQNRRATNKDIAQIEEQIKDIYKQVLRIERPKDEELAKGKGLEKGDASFPCMGLAKDLKKSPRDIADIIKPYLEQLDFVERVESLNGYLNVYYNRAMIFAQMVRG